MNDLKKSIIKQIVFNFLNLNSWIVPAIYDLKKKYKRTFLGPIWNVLSNFILILTISLVWTKVLNLSFKDILPHVFIGLIVWYFISDIFIGSTTLLTEKYNNLFQNTFIPLLTICLRNLFTTFLVFIHNLPVVFFLLFLNFSLLNLLLLIFGIIILLFNLLNLSLIAIFLGTRFRDFKPFASSIVSASTLLTPIMWKKEMLGKYENFVYLNPFTHIIDIVRDPILGNNFNPIVYITSLSFLLIGFLIVHLLFKYKGTRIIFWV